MAERCKIVTRVRPRAERISLIDATVPSGVYAVRARAASASGDDVGRGEPSTQGPVRPDAKLDALPDARAAIAALQPSGDRE